jgi:hypothetical protein
MRAMFSILLRRVEGTRILDGITAADWNRSSELSVGLWCTRDRYNKDGPAYMLLGNFSTISSLKKRRVRKKINK